jgi:molybdate transport system regulatory protein
MRADFLKLKVQIFCGDEIAMGPGKADLLEAIDALGSISAAGRSMGMSYRRTWLLVDVMNRCWRERLVETVAGGGKERGARLTSAGRQILTDYRAMEKAAISATADGHFSHLGNLLRDAPLSSSHTQPAS